MRFTFVILLFCCFGADAQMIIKAHPNYVPLSEDCQDTCTRLILDCYPNAEAAYSLRKLRTAYTGNCIRVRRTGDNVEQNIGFVNNYLDTAALKTFIGSVSGFITTWYDQAGSRNATQTNAANQPNIISASNLTYRNGFVSLFFNTANNQDFLSASRILSNDEFTIFGAASINSPQVATILAQHTGATALNRTTFLGTTTDTIVSIFFNNGANRSVGTTNTYSINSTLSLFESESDNLGTTTIKLNGTGTGTISGQTWTPLNTNTTIGAFGNGSQGITGYISEIIIYSTKQTNTCKIRNAINSYYEIY
jgi:hypothetical protein